MATRTPMNRPLLLPSCNGKVAVDRFCWGGLQAFRFATNNKDIKAALVFYNSGPEQRDKLARITTPVYGLYDGRVNAAIHRSTEQKKKSKRACERILYDGAGHGFMRAGEAPQG